MHGQRSELSAHDRVVAQYTARYWLIKAVRDAKAAAAWDTHGHRVPVVMCLSARDYLHDALRAAELNEAQGPPSELLTFFRAPTQESLWAFVAAAGLWLGE